MPEEPEATEEEEVSVQQLNMIAAVASKSPMLGLVALFVMAGGAGTIGSIYIAPVVDDALEEHARDSDAHAGEFGRIDGLERRLDKIEDQLDNQGRTVSEIKGGIDAVLREVKGNR